MPYRILSHESVEDGLRRTSREQIHRAIDEIDGDLDIHDTVHQVRKRCKKVRAALRLVRTELEISFSDENARFRDAARTLSFLRDSTALIETYHLLADRYREEKDVEAFASIRRRLEDRRSLIVEDEVDTEARIAAFRAEVEKAWVDAADWSVKVEGFDAIRGGVEKTYRRGRKALRDAYDDPTDERFHEFRKRAKYHWYHTRLLQDIWKPVMKARRKQLKVVADLLGDDHDLAVLQQTIVDEPGRFDQRETVDRFLRLLVRHRSTLRTEARFIAERLFAEEPDVLGHRFESYWKAWRMELPRVNRTTPAPLETA